MDDLSKLAAQVAPRRPAWMLVAILVLALLRGGLYASYMPPWGLVDEEQHFHYIQSLAEHGAIPIVGQTYLSAEIVDSLFATQRWEVFHWPTPASHAPESFGLEGHSYEGYQPPLAYLVLVPLYWILPSDILIKLYGLRWALVALSLLTVWMAYGIAAELFPRALLVPPAVALLLVLVPERTMAVSRLNNDVLLEVIATAFVWVFTRAMLRGLTVRRAQTLGLLMGLGLLTKTSMAVVIVLLPLLFWSRRRDAQVLRCVVWTGALAAVLALPLVLRNVWLYGDLTGFAGFQKIAAFQPRHVTGLSLLNAASDLFRFAWVLWWKGAEVGSNPVLRVFYAGLSILSGLSLVGLGRYLWRARQHGALPDVARVVLAYGAVSVGCAIGVVVTYFGGSIPVIQGRFLLPVIAPLLVLFTWGLWCIGSWGPTLALSAAVVLILTDALSLFGNLLPYFYYWSAFASSAGPQHPVPPGWTESWPLFYSRFLLDKPASLRPVLGLLLPLYVVWLVAMIVSVAKARLPLEPDSDWEAVAANRLRLGRTSRNAP